jgi:hypothetical protein
VWGLIVGLLGSSAKDQAIAYGARLMTDTAFRDGALNHAVTAAGKLRGMFKRAPTPNSAAAEAEVDAQVAMLELLATLPSREELASAILAVRTDVDRRLRIAIGVAAASLLTNLIVVAMLRTR